LLDARKQNVVLLFVCFVMVSVLVIEY